MTPRVERPEPGRCPAVVWREETLRLPRGLGFYVSYVSGQCRRKTKDGALCWQHREEGS